MSAQLRVNPIRCAAHGMCAKILPERVTLDDWGYPIVNGTPLDSELAGLARRAISACPVRALSLERPEPARTVPPHAPLPSAPVRWSR